MIRTCRTCLWFDDGIHLDWSPYPCGCDFCNDEAHAMTVEQSNTQNDCSYHYSEETRANDAAAMILKDPF
jgi:hypothetical protein